MGKNILSWFKKNVWAIIVVIAVALFVIPYLFGLHDDYKKWLHEFSRIIFSAGIFAVLLKGLQFSGVFKAEIESVLLSEKYKGNRKREIEDVMIGIGFKETLRAEIGNSIIKNEFLNKRNDLPEIWKEISKLIYKKKFPEISKNIEDLILDKYFPTNDDYYFSDVVISIDISEITDDMVIKYTENWNYNVIMAEGKTKAEMKYSGSVNTDDEHLYECNLKTLKVDDNVIDIKEHPDTFGNIHEFKYVIPLDGQDRYSIRAEYIREISLKNENYSLLRMGRITHGMEVDVRYPEDVEVSFFNIGLVHKFKEHHKGKNGRISRIHKNTVILPQQGFGLSYHKLVVANK